MITHLEIAIANFLQGLITDADPDPPAAAVPSINKGIAPQDRTVVIVTVHDLPRDVGNLYRAFFRITVESPADVPSITAESHAAIEALVTGAFVDANLSAIGDAVSAADASLEMGGAFAEGWKPARAETNWQPYFELILGITTGH